MFIPKKKYNELIKRIETLERMAEVNTFDFGVVNLKILCARLPHYIDERIGKKIAADKSKLSTADKE